MKREVERVCIGHADVDSGTLMVVDPCYVLDTGDRSEYFRVTDVALAKTEGGEFIAHGAATGCITTSGFGDGWYPVYVEIVDYGYSGKRVKRMIVEFISDEEDDLIDETRSN